MEAFSSNSSNSNSTPKTWKYDVFLSFRGEDTRKGFTDYLYHALERGIFRVFRDDEELPRGEVISEQLKQAIENSNFAIVVLSKNYASSSWCLDELQHIFYSRDNLCQQVFPIFYDVDPSDVRYQRRSFHEAFKGHQRKFPQDPQKVQKWRDVLTEVANLSGFDSRQYRYERELIETVVGDLWDKLHSKLTRGSVSEAPIGIEWRVNKMLSLLGIGLHDVRFIGIWGMGGVGKTTLAKAIYERFHKQFDFHFFLANDRELSERYNLLYLQNKLLSHLNKKNIKIEDINEGKNTLGRIFRNKKVMLILDDVNHLRQLENLVGSPEWFGDGSRIIITTRDVHLLRTHQVDDIYKVQPMDNNESLQLFCRKAFRRSSVPYDDKEQYQHLALSAINYTRGLPLALCVLGSFFCGRGDLTEWKDALDMLREDSKNDIFKTLRISYNELTDAEKNIFLYIACFFNMWDKDEITLILESCGLPARTGLHTLREKSLLAEVVLGNYKYIEMHDLVQDMGRLIVIQESPVNVGRRSKLWLPNEIDQLLERDMGTEAIEAVVLPHTFEKNEVHWNPEAFLKMHWLQLLIISCNLDFLLHLKGLPGTLKVLHWYEYPFATLPSKENMDQLVYLKMQNSNIKPLSNENDRQSMKNLQILDLSHSKYFVQTPHFFEFQYLKRLILEGCTSLVEIDSSIGKLHFLVEVNLKGCLNLKVLPKKLETKSLELFVLSGCTQVRNLPEFGERMEKLRTLDVNETSIAKLPESLGLLTGLEILKLRDCKSLVWLPESIHKLKRLVFLDITGCSRFSRLLENSNEMEALEEIDSSNQKEFSSNSSNSNSTPRTYKYDFFLSLRGKDTCKSFTNHLYHALKRSGFYSNSSNSNSTPKTYKYDIFLSFRDEDTRYGFTGHLYHMLKRRGFNVFRGDEELKRGEVISKELLQAIEDSHLAIVVLSKNYASSSWCLNELQHILYSRDNLSQQLVFPIFYDVDPSDVWYQKQSFEKAFLGPQMLQRDKDVLKSWIESLTKVAKLSGWDCKDRPKAGLIDTVVEELWTKFHPKLPPYFEYFIGIENKIKQLEPLLDIGLDDVRFVGIWGLPGVGKTTIARAVFDRYSSQFEIKCFLHNVRATSERNGEVHLQSILLSHLKIRNMKIEDTFEGKKIIQNRFRGRKVLLILDDVSQTSHLENLANGPNWFGVGSRVIITTRDSRLLYRAHEVHIHEVQIMNPDESFQLFCSKAFKRGEPQEDLLHMSKTVCDYAKGLPLALSVLGSFLCGRSSLLEWEDAFDMLKKNQPNEILRVLELSFHELDEQEKAIFLDIACFFNGWNKKVITHILESCGFNANFGIEILKEKSMLKDYRDCLVMHDLLEQMGRRIVVDKSPDDVGNRSRLWNKKDIDEVMGKNLGTKGIQCMVSSTSCEASWDPEAFSTFHNLRLLIVTTNFILPHGLECLPHSLKVLHWTKYPLDTLPPRARLYKLVDLKMRHSKLNKLWNKSPFSMNLKFLDLSYSKNLAETPDLYELPNLERLELESCENIVDLHASIGQHTKLRVLNLKDCKKLKNWCLKKLEMPALQEFVLCGCIQIKCLPKFGESMKNLKILDAGETNLVKLPESLGLLTSLETLKLRGCKTLVCLPQSIHKLKRLVFIDIASCSRFARLPENLNEMEALEEIDVSETDITEVPSSIGGLNKIKKLSFQECKRLTKKSWRSIHPLNHMFWGHSIHKGSALPDSIFNLKSLKELNLSYCGINDGSVPDSFSGLSSLEKLNLSGNLFKKLHAGCLSNLLKLEVLLLNSCSELGSLPQLGPNLWRVYAGDCGSLEAISDEQLSHLFTSIDQDERLIMGDSLDVAIPGSEIPSWFKNQQDLFLNHYGEAWMMIDMRACGEEMLGIGLCIVIDDQFFCTEPNKRPPFGFLNCWFDFAKIPHPPNFKPQSYSRVYGYQEDMKSSHLWIVFWKQKEEVSRCLQLSEYSHIPLKFSAWPYWQLDSKDWKMDRKDWKIKCGWRVIRKGDFKNWDHSMSQRLLPAAEQPNGQDVRTPMPIHFESRSISVRPIPSNLDYSVQMLQGKDIELEKERIEKESRKERKKI